MPDTDGLISLVLMCQFCDMMGRPYSYYVNGNRYHGFEINPQRLNGYLVVASDFQITDKEVEAIVQNNIVLLSTDHHDCQRTFIESKYGEAEGIVINNQYPFEPEEDRYLSGAGVFYELICSLYPDFKSSEREALVGITLLSDVRQIENSKARRYLKTTYSIDPTQGYINYLIQSTKKADYGFGVPRLDRNFIDFNLSPCINALLRYDKTLEAVNFVLGKGLSSTKTRDSQKELIVEMSNKVNICDMGNLSVLAINGLDFLDLGVSVTNFIGLLCSDYKDKHNGVSTLGFVYENGKVLRTSFRGRYDDIHYNSAFKNLGLDVHGHPTSFGIIDFKPTEDTWFQLNDLVGDLESSHKPTITVIKSSNLGLTVTKDGMNMATENCYVRDMYRHYIEYTGNNARIIKETYKQEEFTTDDYLAGVKPDITVRGVDYKYVRDANNNPIKKYIEYLIDGRKVKSFGVAIEDGYILPVLEKGYIQLYVRSKLD